MADYHSLLMRAVANLPNSGTPATRGAIYERARKALLEQLRSLRPPLPESDIIREETALNAAIAEIEKRYAPQDPGPPVASPTPTSALSRKAGSSAKGCTTAPAISLRSSARVRPTASGPAAPSARSPSQTGAPGQAGTQQPCPFRARCCGLRRRHRDEPSQPGALSSSADPGRGQASRIGADCGFAGSIPAGGCNGQPALLRIEDRTSRSTGGGDGRQG